MPNKNFQADAAARFAGVFLAVFIVAHALGFFLQKPAAIYEGLGWDGTQYAVMMKEFSEGETKITKARAPFSYRLLTPWLAAKTHAALPPKKETRGLTITSGSSQTRFEINNPRTIARNFFAVNALASFGALIFILLIMQSRAIDWRAQLAAAAIFMWNSYAPVRVIYWLPISTDALNIFFIAAGLWLADWRQKSGHIAPLVIFIPLAFLAALNRETGLLAPLAAMFCAAPFAIGRGWQKTLKSVEWGFLPALFAGVFGLVIARQLAVPTDEYGGDYAASLVTAAYEKPLGQIVLGVCYAVGPVAAVLLWRWRAALRFFADNQHFAAVMAVTAVWMLVVEAERPMLWAAPAWAVALAAALDDGLPALRKAPVLCGALAVAQAISMRLFWGWPHTEENLNTNQPPAPQMPDFLTIFGDNFYALDLSTKFAQDGVGEIALIQYIVVIFIFVMCLRTLEVREGGGQTSKPKSHKRRRR